MLFNTLYVFLPNVYLHVWDHTNYVHTLFSETTKFTCKVNFAIITVTRIENYILFCNYNGD